MLLFELVNVELLDHGHKIIHCWTPKDNELVERGRELLDLLDDLK